MMKIAKIGVIKPQPAQKTKSLKTKYLTIRLIFSFILIVLF
jgi:hypothetical protein